jgi:membrane protease YdiL (CAAX protease family)
MRFAFRASKLRAYPVPGTPMRQIVLVALVFAAVLAALRLAGFGLAGPPAVLAACLAAWWLQRREAEPIGAWGLARPASIGRALLWSLAALGLGYAAAIAAVLVATRGFGWPTQDTARIAQLIATPWGLAGMLALAWSAAAVGEEVLFRGFLLHRLRVVLGSKRGAGLAGVGLQALLFGASHAYQGPTGILLTGAIGFAFGLIVLRTRSLWPVMLAHGLMDTLSLAMLHARSS